jgi:hypothetical protein
MAGILPRRGMLSTPVTSLLAILLLALADGGAAPVDAGAPDAAAAAIDAAPHPDAAPAAPPDGPPAEPAIPAGAVEVVVTLRERGTRTPIAGAFVQLQPRRAGVPPVEGATDEAGVARLHALPGRYRLYVAPADHAELSRDLTVAAKGPNAVAAYLPPRDRPEEVVDIKESVPTPSAVRREMPVEQLQKLPGTQGDALKVVQNLPGAARMPFGAGGLVLRGASPRDSRAFIDGLEIPQLFHFGGIVSVYNSDMLQSIELYPGGFDAHYGRAQGGIVEVYSRVPKTDRLHGYVDMNFIDTTAMAEGPVPESMGGGSFAVAVRRSYIDVVLAFALPARADFDLLVAPRYYDFQARYDRTLDRGGHLAIYAFGSDDRLEFLRTSPVGLPSEDRGQFLNQVRFQRGVAKYELFKERWSTTTVFAAGYDQVKLAFGERGTDQQRVPIILREDLKVTLSPDLELTTGLDLQGGYWHYGSTRPPILLPGQTRDPTLKQADVTQTASHPFFLGAAYASGKWRVAPWLSLLPSVRADYYHVSRELVVDPRLVLREPIGEKITLHQNAGLYHQPPGDVDVDPVFGNPDLTSSYALQLGSGVSWKAIEGLKVDVDLFFNQYFALPVPSQTGFGPNATGSRNRNGGGAPELFGAQFGLLGFQTDAGRGRAYGGELLVKRETSRWFGWVAYTLSHAERKDYADEPYHVYAFDQTHILTALLSWKLPRGYRLGGRMRLVSGNPSTPVTGAYLDADTGRYAPTFGEINSQRVPLFHQLDLRFDKEWTFETWTLAFYLDVQNVYNHQSVEGIRYNFDFTQVTNVTGLPLLPSFGIKGSF